VSPNAGYAVGVRRRPSSADWPVWASSVESFIADLSSDSFSDRSAGRRTTRVRRRAAAHDR
jgi:hypothetical protein